MLVLTFEIAGARVALDVRQIREVVQFVQVQRPSSGPPWLAGVFVYRGRMVPVIDLQRLVGGGECPSQLSTRIILVPRGVADDEELLGLLAPRVADVRDIDPKTNAANCTAGPQEAGQPDLGPVLVENGAMLHLLDLDRLIPPPYRRQLALTSEGSS